MKEVIDTEANVKQGCTFEELKTGKLVRDASYTDSRMVPKFGSAEAQRLKYYLEKPTPRNNFGQKIADCERLPYYEHANEAYEENRCATSIRCSDAASTASITCIRSWRTRRSCASSSPSRC
mgnify:FL=1